MIPIWMVRTVDDFCYVIRFDFGILGVRISFLGCVNDHLVLL